MSWHGNPLLHSSATATAAATGEDEVPRMFSKWMSLSLTAMVPARKKLPTELKDEIKYAMRYQFELIRFSQFMVFSS